MYKWNFSKKYLLPYIVKFELVWLRYVDDVFAALPDNIDLDNFLASLKFILSNLL